MFRTVKLGSVPAQPISGQGQWAVAQAAPDVNGVFTLVRRYRTRAAAARRRRSSPIRTCARSSASPTFPAGAGVGSPAVVKKLRDRIEPSDVRQRMAEARARGLQFEPG
jgi:hypothetical protein